MANFLNGKDVDLIIKNKEIYKTAYLDNYGRFEKNHSDAIKSECFYKRSIE